MATAASVDEIQLAIAAAVDADFYRDAYPEIADLGVTPCSHYADAGWREGRDPAPWFSTRAYLDLYPDVVEAGVNPLFHFLRSGGREGRSVEPSALADDWRRRRRAIGQPLAWRFDAADRALAAAEFDGAYYLDSNPDVAQAGFDPLEHFLTLGWREGRDPSARFSLADYLNAYPDVARLGVNPFLHYLAVGRDEGRSPLNRLGFRFGVISRLKPASERLARVARESAMVEARPAQILREALAEAGDLSCLHVGFSHDDYRLNLGGVQLCIQREAAGMTALGRRRLHVFPARAWTTVRTAAEPCPLGVILDGELLGHFRGADVAEALAALPKPTTRDSRSFAIHSLLGHDVDEVLAILAALGLARGYFWLHDFASLCAGFHLLRNEVQDCGAPPPDSAACGVCVHLPLRERHLDAHAKLFEALSLTVAAPSAAALATWKQGWAYPAVAEVVHPHARFVPAEASPAEPGPGPLRVAFLGMPVTHKGWPVFRDLAFTFAGDPRYAFLHLGKRPPGRLPIEVRQVKVSAEQPDAMQAALVELGVDVAMVWSLCRETFSFTAYEAVAAGAAVLTCPDSGNVAAMVEAEGCGRVLADEAALHAAFESGSILELARAARRPVARSLAYGALSADLLVVQDRP